MVKIEIVSPKAVRITQGCPLSLLLVNISLEINYANRHLKRKIPVTI